MGGILIECSQQGAQANPDRAVRRFQGKRRTSASVPATRRLKQAGAPRGSSVAGCRSSSYPAAPSASQDRGHLATAAAREQLAYPPRTLTTVACKRSGLFVH